MQVIKIFRLLTTASLYVLSLNFSPLAAAANTANSPADIINSNDSFLHVGSNQPFSFILGVLHQHNGSNLLVHSGNLNNGAGSGFTPGGRPIPASCKNQRGAFSFSACGLSIDNLTIGDGSIFGSDVELSSSFVLTINGTVTVDSGASLTVSSGLENQVNNLINNGSVSVTGGRLNITDSVINNNTINISSGAELSNNGSRMSVYTQNSGTTTVNGTLSADTVSIQGGLLKGSGIIDGNLTVSGGGQVGPGNSPGVLTIDGTFTLGPNGTLLLEVGDSLWDQLIAQSYDFTGGDIQFTLLESVDINTFTNNFIIDDFLRVGDQFTNLGYLESGLSLTTFSDVNFTAYDFSSDSWYNLSLNSGGSFSVAAVPIPAAVWLFASGLLGLIALGKGKRTA